MDAMLGGTAPVTEATKSVSSKKKCMKASKNKAK